MSGGMPAGTLFPSGFSETMASVVSRSAAMLAAFCNAERVTFVGSTTPAFSMSSYWSVAALNPYNYEINSNIYSGPNLIKAGNTTYSTLAAWQKASGQDKNSISKQPKKTGRSTCLRCSRQEHY